MIGAIPSIETNIPITMLGVRHTEILIANEMMRQDYDDGQP